MFSKSLYAPEPESVQPSEACPSNSRCSPHNHSANEPFGMTVKAATARQRLNEKGKGRGREHHGRTTLGPIHSLRTSPCGRGLPLVVQPSGLYGKEGGGMERGLGLIPLGEGLPDPPPHSAPYLPHPTRKIRGVGLRPPPFLLEFGNLLV